MFACTLSGDAQGNTLFFFDEIDAALDENNSAIVAKLIRDVYNNKQVLCVSHHPTFQSEAKKILRKFFFSFKNSGFSFNSSC